MTNIEEFLSTRYFGNTVEKYLWFIGILIIGILLRKFISKISSRLLYRLFSRYANDISAERFYSLLHKPFKNFILLIFIYFASDQLKFPTEWNLAHHSEFGLRMILEKGFLLLMSANIIWIVLSVVDVIGEIMKIKANQRGSKSNDQIVSFLVDALKVMVVVLGVFISVGTVLNLNVGSLVAGLGIGGLAIALAAKETLENLLGSFTIFLDKPFVQGDLVKVHDITGVVEKVGFRSTRIRTLEKTFVTIPNKRMVDAELDNMSLRTLQRAKFNIELDIHTSYEKINAIISDLKNFCKNQHLITEDYLVNFHEMSKGAIAIQVVYFVNSTDYTVFCHIKESVNYEIIGLVKKHTIEFYSPCPQS